MIVVDNTVLVHYALSVSSDQDRAAALAVMTADPDWRAPQLWASEFRHVAMRYVRGGKLDLADAISAAVAADLLVLVEPVGHDEVLRTADACSLSGYDAEYAALAARLGVPLVTSDRRLREAVPGALDPASVAAG